mmetsp:Transcript_23679/g.59274  ORF Transcript_23679/g.59274 Transcript_23679/m.59274 type:complete len:274 (-) Transcript_23679:846-1667(-)
MGDAHRSASLSPPPTVARFPPPPPLVPPLLRRARSLPLSLSLSLVVVCRLLLVRRRRPPLLRCRLSAEADSPSEVGLRGVSASCSSPPSPAAAAPALEARAGSVAGALKDSLEGGSAPSGATGGSCLAGDPMMPVRTPSHCGTSRPAAGACASMSVSSSEVAPADAARGDRGGENAPPLCARSTAWSGGGAAAASTGVASTAGGASGGGGPAAALATAATGSPSAAICCRTAVQGNAPIWLRNDPTHHPLGYLCSTFTRAPSTSVSSNSLAAA